MNETNVTRVEKKYLPDAATAARLRAALSLSLPCDRPGRPEGYLVRSLYFDTITDRDYQDKTEGLDNRRKIRLRIYSPEDTMVKLEVKEKNRRGQWKRSIGIGRADAERLIAGDYGVLEAMDAPFAREVGRLMHTQGYIAKTIVQFRRLAYKLRTNNTRITFDTRLEATEASFDLFAPRLALYPIFFPVILEVKYSNFLLSYVKELLGTLDEMELSVSKYCLGRQISFY